MAGESGQPTDAVKVWRDLEEHLERFEFFAAMRQIECAHPALPRLGKSARAAQDAVRLGQVPSLAFAPSMLAEMVRRADGRVWLGGLFFGLFGPNGPLPLHLTEYAHDRRHNLHDPTFAGFADVFHHRLLCLFYRAWADAQPAVQYDRPNSDRFAAYLGSLIGLGQPALRDRDELPDYAKLGHAGRLASQSRNAEGLQALLEDFFLESVSVLEFQGEWMRLEAGDRLRLGNATSFSALGVGATLGECVWGVQHRFRVRVGPMSLQRFERFLPGTNALAQLEAAVRNYVGFELAWDLQLILERDDVPGIVLGERGRLGWTAWLKTQPMTANAGDLVLDIAA